MADNIQELAVLDFPSQNYNQRFVVDIVKTTFDIPFYEPNHARKIAGNLPQGGVTTPFRPKPMGAIVKRRLINGFQYHSDCFLQKFVPEGRYSKRTLLPVSLFDILPPDWFGPVAAVSQFLNHLLNILFAESIRSVIIAAFGGCAFVCVELLVGGVINIFPQQISVEPREHAVFVVV